MSTQQKFKLSEIAKYPAAYVIFIMAGLIGYFSRSWGESAGGRAEDSKYREEQCQIDLRSERREKDALVKQLLIKQGTIDAVTTLADSVRPNPAKPN
jgi:hypothetical protein